MSAPDPVTRLSSVVAAVLAPNPGPMTLTGTNTWVLGDPALGAPIVVDPGPLDGGHLDRVLAVAGGHVAAVLLTHRHLDHAESAASFAARAGCRVRAADPVWRVGEEGLDDGAVLDGPGVRLEVVATPGHTSDSVCLLVGSDTTTDVDLVTGDTVLGSGSTVITHPDGDVGAYLASLDRLLSLVEERRVRRLLPGHGHVVADPAGVLRGCSEHRRARLDEVRAALAAGARTPEDVLAAVYPEVVGTPLARAALQSVRAQLDHLDPHRER